MNKLYGTEIDWFSLHAHYIVVHGCLVRVGGLTAVAAATESSSTNHAE